MLMPRNNLRHFSIPSQSIVDFVLNGALGGIPIANIQSETLEGNG